jgi:hypothetical protein
LCLFNPCQPFVAHRRPLTVPTSLNPLTPRVDERTIRLGADTVAETTVGFCKQADAAPKVLAAISMPGVLRSTALWRCGRLRHPPWGGARFPRRWTSWRRWRD